LAVQGQTEIPDDAIKETKLLLNETTTLGSIMIESITSIHDNIIRLPDIYEHKCNLRFIRIICNGLIGGNKINQPDIISLDIYIGKHCIMKLLGPEKLEHEGAHLTQFGMTGEKILVEQKVFSGISNTKIGNETKETSSFNILETITKLNNKHFSITKEPDQLNSNITITNSTIATQKANQILTNQINTTTETITITTMINEETTTSANANEARVSTIVANTLEDEKGLETKYIYIVCVIMSITIIAMISTIIRICHNYQLVEKNRFRYLTSVVNKSYTYHDDIELSETRVRLN